MNPINSGTPANEPMTIDRIYTLPPDLQQQILAFAEFVEFREISNTENKEFWLLENSSQNNILITDINYES